MKTIKLALSALLIPALASAQPDADGSAQAFDHDVPAVQNAVEIGVAGTYSQGGGNLGGQMSNLEDLASAGGGVEVDIGARIIPNLTVAAYGTLAQYADGDQLKTTTTDVYGATAGVQATWHFRPSHSVDPFVTLGTGWKALWLNPTAGKVTSLQGLELARLQVGADYRVTKDIAIAPVIGGSLGMFVSQDSPMTTDYTEIADKKVNFTGYAGIAGRFDVGGSRR
jgi:outer membrane protein W